jgi:SET domain-containing protein
MEMPEGFFVELRDSTIHGKGLFATRNFKFGETVCPGRLNGKRTPGGRFINHSPNCNVKPEKRGDDIYAVAIKNINTGDELLVDYRASMQVNFGLSLQGELL